MNCLIYSLCDMEYLDKDNLRQRAHLYQQSGSFTSFQLQQSGSYGNTDSSINIRSISGRIREGPRQERVNGKKELTNQI